MQISRKLKKEISRNNQPKRIYPLKTFEKLEVSKIY